MKDNLQEASVCLHVVTFLEGRGTEQKIMLRHKLMQATASLFSVLLLCYTHSTGHKTSEQPVFFASLKLNVLYTFHIIYSGNYRLCFIRSVLLSFAYLLFTFYSSLSLSPLFSSSFIYFSLRFFFSFSLSFLFSFH
jgi:hypothetical protein